MALALYAGAALIAVFELLALWGALHPSVGPDYRAYFIDRTTTCLNREVTGFYQMGTMLWFRSLEYGPGERVKVCGWDGPAGDGLHSVGEESRLRFNLGSSPAPQTLTISLSAIKPDNQPRQRVRLIGNGIQFAEIAVPAGASRTFRLPLPPAVFAEEPHQFDLILAYPDAVRLAPTDADVGKRAIKLLAVRLR